MNRPLCHPHPPVSSIAPNYCSCPQSGIPCGWPPPHYSPRSPFHLSAWSQRPQRVSSHGSSACAPAPQPGLAPGKLTSPWDLAEGVPQVDTVHSEKPEEAGRTRRVQQRGWGGTTPPWVSKPQKDLRRCFIEISRQMKGSKDLQGMPHKFSHNEALKSLRGLVPR